MIKNILNEQLKTVVRSSKIYQSAFNRINANKLATRSHRLDLCASEVAIFLLQSGKDKYVLRDKICLEIGCGMLPIYSLVFYLLGVKKVYATDLHELLQPSCIFKAISSSVPSSILDSLSIFEDRANIKRRLDKLLALQKLDLGALRDLGIDYIAPIDLSQELPIKEKIDFIFSKVVLQQVAVDDVIPLLENLEGGLSENGFMFHFIHLLNLRNLEKPFDFFKYPQELYSRDMQGRWGNRIRRNQWQQIFDNLKHTSSRFVIEWSCTDTELPNSIHSSVIYIDEEDLRVSHIGCLTEKKSETQETNFVPQSE